MKFYLYSNNNLFDGYHIAVLYVYSIIFRALHARVCGVFDMIMIEDGKIIFVFCTVNVSYRPCQMVGSQISRLFCFDI